MNSSFPKSYNRSEPASWGRGPWAKLVTSLLALGAMMGTAAQASTSVAELPLKASVLAKPNVIFAMDDSGSMDWELMIDGTFQGVFYANYWDATLYPGSALRTGSHTADWPLYYLFPNGTGAGNRVYGDPHPRYGHAVPPTAQMAWTRSPAFNSIYYDTMRTYQHWAPGFVSGATQTFANANPSAARSHPVNGSTTMALNTDLSSNTTDWRFTFLAGMEIPTNASNIQCLWGAAPPAQPWATPWTVDTSRGLCTAQVPYYPATFWHRENCTVNGTTCAAAWNGQTLRRYEIKTGNTFPSGRSFVDEMQNFANWFTYYRKRRLMLGAAMGDVLENLSGLRMGVVAFNDRVPPAMFDADAVAAGSNRLAVTGRFYTAEGNGGTPTHATMSYIHNQFDTNTNIIQFACQRNAQFIITDGFANDTATAPLAYNQTQYGATAPYQAIAANSLHDKALSAFTYRLRASGAGVLTAGRVPLGSAAVQNPDTNPNLHINTYALTLGMRGTLWPSATNPFVTAPAWPAPVANTATMIDDLWHATINGRGQMYLATTPEQTTLNIQAGLLDILGQSGAQSGVAVATVNLVRGDNRAYFGLYDPAGWKGDVVARPISQDTAVVSTEQTWSASALLLARSWSSRVIASQNNDGTGLRFTAADVGAQVNDGGMYGNTTEVMNYLRGDRTHEGTKFRQRTGLMGAIINSEPAVDRAEKVLYVASGEGMLHAFDTTPGSGQGQELWAFVPRAVLADIGSTTSRAYTFKTQLDGTPVLGTIGGNKKILVAGMGAAGRSYYALDVSAPRGLTEEALASKVMWEFPAANDSVTRAKVGQTLGRPVIAHSPDNGWVVLVTSGYNNTHDGKGRMWMLNANTGAIIHEFETSEGTLTVEAGLTHVVGFDDGTGKTRYAYGGDLRGNVWRFDLKDKTAPHKVAELKGPTNEVQPVTAPLELATLSTELANHRVLVIPTGRMLDSTDFGKAELRRQSVYVIKDGATLTNPRSSLKQQVYTPSPESLTGDTVNWDTDRGWYVDLPVDEQANTRPSIVYGGVSLVTNKTGATDCAASSRLYLFDLRSGKKYAGATFIGTDISTTNNANSVTPVITKDGKVRFVTQDFEGNTPTPSSAPPPVILPGKAAWREIRRQ